MAKRARRIREVVSARFGYSQKEFAEKFLGVDYKLWNHAETGYSLGIKIALAVVNKVPGLTLDYIYRGDVRGMPENLIQELDLALEQRGTTP